MSRVNVSILPYLVFKSKNLFCAKLKKKVSKNVEFVNSDL